MCQRQEERATIRIGGVRLVREGSPKNGVIGGWGRFQGLVKAWTATHGKGEAT